MIAPAKCTADEIAILVGRFFTKDLQGAIISHVKLIPHVSPRDS